MDLVEEFLRTFFSGSQPWWVYTLAVLIPLSFVLTVRELNAWFFKLNKLVDRLERIEKALLRLQPGSLTDGQSAKVRKFSRRTGKAQQENSEL